MSERTSYEPGTPSWVDLASPDPDAAASFYGGLFGWEVQSAGPVEETGGYGMFTLRGKQVAGVGPIMQEGQPPAWSTYVATDDADAAAKRAASGGANVIVEPMDVMDAGELGVLSLSQKGALEKINYKGWKLTNPDDMDPAIRRDEQSTLAFGDGGGGDKGRVGGAVSRDADERRLHYHRTVEEKANV